MDAAILLYAEGDRSSADALAAALPCTRVMKVGVAAGDAPIAFGPHLPLIFVWSRRAEAARLQLSFAAIARAHAGDVIVAATDQCAPPQSFGVVVDAGVRDFAAAAERALAARRAAEAPEPRQGRAFAAGVARGLVGGVAVFGVGGIAIGASSQFEPSAGAAVTPAAPTPVVAKARAEVVTEVVAITRDADAWLAAIDEADTIEVAAVDAPAPSFTPFEVSLIAEAPLEIAAEFESLSLTPLASLEEGAASLS
jgi:hypothetical protein